MKTKNRTGREVGSALRLDSAAEFLFFISNDHIFGPTLFKGQGTEIKDEMKFSDVYLKG